MQHLLDQYYTKLEEIKTLKGISALLNWDQENQMPPKAIESRAKQSAMIEKLIHQKNTAKDYKDLVYELYEKQDKLSEIDKRSLYLSKKELDKSFKLPAEFVENFANLKSRAQQAWAEAKAKDIFTDFKPLLKEMFDYTKQYANLIDNSKPIYDVLLDDYE